MKKLSVKKGSAMLEWLTSYILIVLFMTMVLFFVSGWYNSMLKSEIEKYNNYVFETVSNNISSGINNVEKLKNELIKNQNVAEISSIRTINECYSNKSVFSLIDEFKSLSSSDNIRVYIYMPQADCTISEYGVLPSYDFYLVCMKNSGMSYELWKQNLVNQDNLGEYSFYLMQDSTRSMEVASRNFQINEVIASIATDRNLFFKQIENRKFKLQYDVGIYNELGKLIFSYCEDEESPLPKKIADTKKYDENVYYMDKEIIKFPSASWTSVMMIEKDAITSQTRSIMIKVVFFVLAALLVCMWFIKRMVTRNYRPIAEIKKTLNVDSGNDYDEIRKKIHHIIQENITAAETVEKNIKEKEELEINSILYTPDFLDEKFRSKFDKPLFAVVCFYLNDIDAFFADLEDMSKKGYYFSYIVNNVFSELYAEKGISLYHMYSKGEVACLLNFDDNNNLNQQDIEKIAQKGVNIINTEFDIAMMCSVSSVYDDVGGIKKAYYEAKEIMDSMILIGMRPKKIGNANITSPNLVVLSVENQKKLINCLQKGDKVNAMEIITEAFETIKKSHFSKSYINIMMYDIICTIMKSAVVDDEDWNTFMVEECVMMLCSINEKYSINEMFDKISTVVDAWCEKNSEKIQRETEVNKNQKRLLEILSYINKNYCSSGINVSTVAYEFGLTPYYISKVFKEYVNEGMMDYINRMRIERAEYLINEKNYTVNEAAEMVGFTYVKTFYRVYKKFTGTTPKKKKN